MLPKKRTNHIKTSCIKVSAPITALVGSSDHLLLGAWAWRRRTTPWPPLNKANCAAEWRWRTVAFLMSMFPWNPTKSSPVEQRSLYVCYSISLTGWPSPKETNHLKSSQCERKEHFFNVIHTMAVCRVEQSPLFYAKASRILLLRNVK